MHSGETHPHAPTCHRSLRGNQNVLQFLRGMAYGTIVQGARSPPRRSCQKHENTRFGDRSYGHGTKASPIRHHRPRHTQLPQMAQAYLEALPAKTCCPPLCSLLGPGAEKLRCGRQPTPRQSEWGSTNVGLESATPHPQVTKHPPHAGDHSSRALGKNSTRTKLRENGWRSMCITQPGRGSKPPCHA